MKLLTFKGGIHPPYGKEYANKKPIEKAAAPAKVYIPLQQHIGAPAKCIVAVGDEVKLGQKIGEAQGFVSSNIHSSLKLFSYVAFLTVLQCVLSLKTTSKKNLMKV